MLDISVIVPCYNGAEVLSRCLDSLLKQTQPLKEIIIVNDGSTDGSEALAMQYAMQHPTVKVVTKQNQGLPQARKTGVEAASGSYIGCVDCDDWVEPNAYECLYNALINSGADIATAGFCNCYSSGAKKAAPQTFADGSVHTGAQAFHALHTRQDVFPYMWNKLYRKELFDTITFPEGNFTGEDYVTLIQLLKKAGSVVTVTKQLFNYWSSDDSMSRGGFRPSHSLSYSYYKQAAADLISTYPEMESDVHCYMAVEYMAYILAMNRNKNYDMDMLRDIRRYIRTNLCRLLSNRDFPLLYKGSAAAFAIHHRLLTTIYSPINNRH